MVFFFRNAKFSHAFLALTNTEKRKMKLKIHTWGNGAGIGLPAKLLEQFNITVGDRFAIDIQDNGVLLTPVRRTFRFADLIALCDQGAPMPADMVAWTQVESHGREM